jgi:hypothetical protein
MARTYVVCSHLIRSRVTRLSNLMERYVPRRIEASSDTKIMMQSKDSIVGSSTANVASLDTMWTNGKRYWDSRYLQKRVPRTRTPWIVTSTSFQFTESTFILALTIVNEVEELEAETNRQEKSRPHNVSGHSRLPDREGSEKVGSRVRRDRRR